MIGAMPLRLFLISSGTERHGGPAFGKTGFRARGKGMVCLALLLALILSPGSFAAADSLAGLAERYENGEAMELRAELVLRQVPGMNAALLEKVNGWLGRSAVTVRAQKGDGGEKEYALLTFDGIDVLEARTIKTGDGTVTVFPGSGRAYRTREGEFSFLEGMTGDDSFPVLSPDWGETLIFRLAPRFYEIVSESAEETAEETADVRVKNVGVSPMQTVYVLAADSANALWPGMTAFFAAGSSALLAYRTMEAENAAQGLENLVFTGVVTVTRLYDADGRDMGIRVNGRCRPGDGSERKLTLTFGGIRGSDRSRQFAAPLVEIPVLGAFPAYEAARGGPSAQHRAHKCVGDRELLGEEFGVAAVPHVLAEGDDPVERKRRYRHGDLRGAAQLEKTVLLAERPAHEPQALFCVRVRAESVVTAEHLVAAVHRVERLFALRAVHIVLVHAEE